MRNHLWQKRLPPLFAAILICLIASTRYATGLGLEAFGPAGEHMGISSDWPKGVQPLLKHGSRVYWQDVNGYSQSYYQGDVEQINELLKLFSEIEMKRHMVILRPGSAKAKSFGGKEVPYLVKFDLPAGLFLFHAKEHAKSGLYSTDPTLVIYVNEDWVEQLSTLKVPEPVELYRSQYSLDALLHSAEKADRNTRCRALSFLGETGVDSEEIRKLLEKCSQEEDRYIKRNASQALAKLDEQKQHSDKLTKGFSEFLDKHPRLHHTMSAEEMLKILQDTDAKYATEGFTARGTLVNHEGNLMNWVVSMGNDRLVVRQSAAKELATGRIEHTIFVSPDDMVTIQRSQYWVNGELIKSKPFKSVEPVGNTYDLLIGRILWPLGRGFTRRIDRVESVREQHDGTLDVVAFGENNLGIRWDLTVDPAASYLIRTAKGYRTRHGENAKAQYVIDGAGVLSDDERSANHTARWMEGEDAEPISIAVHEVTSKPDLNLIIELEESIVDGRKSDAE